jgi:hypothetical protein
MQPAPDREPPPDLLLASLLKAARVERRRRSLWLIASGAVAATVVAITVFLGGTNDGPTQPAATTVAMTPVRAAAVTGTLQLTPTTWGTRVSLDCRWIGATDGADWNRKKAYRLVAVPTDGTESRVLAQWAVLPGEDATVVGSTDLATERIAKIELRAVADDAVLLEADPA